MNALIKLTDTHYIVVGDSEIKEGDWFYNQPTNFIGQTLRKEGDFWVCNNIEGFHLLSEAKKIHYSTQPLEPGVAIGFELSNCFDKIKPLSLSEVEEALYGCSVDDLAFKAFKKQDEWTWTQFKDIFPYGFNAHKELVEDKLFTMEQMQKAMDFMYWFCQNVPNEYLEHNYGIKNTGDLNTNQAITVYIQSLLPKTERECTIDEQGKLKLI